MLNNKFPVVPTFEEVHALSERVSSPVLLQPWEAELLYKMAIKIPAGGVLVEVGSHYGRSSSLLLQVAKAIGFSTIHVDPYADDDNYHGQEEILAGWRVLMDGIGHPYTLHRVRTIEADSLLPAEIDAAYIDGDHEGPGVAIDLRVVANRVKSGGYLATHDYGKTPLTPGCPPERWEHRFPDLTRVVDEYVATGWEHIGIAETMSVWRRK